MQSVGPNRGRRHGLAALHWLQRKWVAMGGMVTNNRHSRPRVRAKRRARARSTRIQGSASMGIWDADPAAIADLKRRVSENGGVLTVDMCHLRDIGGAKKLVPVVVNRIKWSLDRELLGHYPAELPTRQEAAIRLYELDSPLGKVMTACLTLDEHSDNVLRKLAAGGVWPCASDDVNGRNPRGAATLHAHPSGRRPAAASAADELRGRDRRGSLAAVRWPTLFEVGVIRVGDRLVLRTGSVDAKATFSDEQGNVSYNGHVTTPNKWGTRMTGWSTINIYAHAFVEYEGQLTPLQEVRQHVLNSWRGPEVG